MSNLLINENLPLVSVIVITYKRFDLLKRTIEAFQSKCKYPNLEYILCDDGSDKKTQEKMCALKFDKFLMNEENRGLGYNINKGILAAKGKYIFQLEDDWFIDMDFGRDLNHNSSKDFILAGLEIFEERSEIYMVRYWPIECENWDIKKYPSHDLYTTDSGIKTKVFENKVVYKYHVYTNRPHIKRKSFHEKLGLYKEDVHMSETEIEFTNRVESQKEIKIAQVEGYHIFKHIGKEQSFNKA